MDPRILIAAPLIHACMWLPLVTRTYFERPGAGPRRDCRVCHYDLAGLPLASLCPECGTTEPALPGRIRFIVRPECARKGRHILVFTIIAGVLCGCLFPIIGVPILALKVRMSGYAWDVAWRYANSPEAHLATPAALQAYFSFLFVIVSLSPLASIIPPKCKPLLLLWCLLGVAFVIAYCSV